jgi:DUF3010 family protein
LIICGIELSGSTASIVMLDGSADDFNVVDTGITKLKINDSESAQDVISFYDSFHSFIRNHNVEKIGIKKRSLKPKKEYASGPITFKMEGLIQLSKDPEVVLIHSNTISAKLRKDPPPNVKIFKYQAKAYETAYTLLRIEDG